jgi:hypothetical protein
MGTAILGVQAWSQSKLKHSYEYNQSGIVYYHCFWIKFPAVLA